MLTAERLSLVSMNFGRFILYVFMAMDDGVDFSADHQDQTGQEEPQDQDDQTAETAICGAVTAEIRYVERERERYKLP